MFFNNYCTFCLKKTEKITGICNACFAELPWQSHACLTCALPLKNFSAKNCGQCLASAPPISHCMAPLIYDNAIAKLITELKFHEHLEHAKTLAKLMLIYIEKNQIALPECIIPIPLHKKRLRSRGFNQALEIAKPLAKQLDIPIDTKYCVRSKNTQAQSELNATERRGNLKNAFHMKGDLPYRHVAIIDDVMTTGNTVFECAKALQQQDLQTIQVWCAARAV